MQAGCGEGGRGKGGGKETTTGAGEEEGGGGSFCSPCLLRAPRCSCACASGMDGWMARGVVRAPRRACAVPCCACACAAATGRE